MMPQDTIKVNWNHTFKRTAKDNQRINRIEKDKSKKGFSVRKCPVCNKPWEKRKSFMTGDRSWLHIDDFPTYGLDIKTCPDHE